MVNVVVEAKLIKELSSLSDKPEGYKVLLSFEAIMSFLSQKTLETHDIKKQILNHLDYFDHLNRF